MKKEFVIKFKFSLATLLIAFFTQSCSVAPEEYKKGQEMYAIQKYDSALFYFSAVKPDAIKWLDSAKQMRKNCFSAMIENNQFDMLSQAFNIYKNDIDLYLDGVNNLSKRLYTILNSSQKAEAFRILDEYKKTLPEVALNNSLEKYLNYTLLDAVWEVKGAGLNGYTVYFERESLKVRKGVPLINAIQGKSNVTNSGWKKGKIIYKNITYTKNGEFDTDPLIFRGAQSYYGKRGVFVVKSHDSLVINYGARLSNGSKITLVRSTKNKTTN